MKYREVIRILEAHGFELSRQKGSHRAYVRYVKGEKWIVTVAPHSLNEDVKKGTLSSIRRQSGLPKKLFEK
jgi:predicted RNA binding protein YcfA (HicA-like mRNA interferase family)